MMMFSISKCVFQNMRNENKNKQHVYVYIIIQIIIPITVYNAL